ncbi:putative sialic acid transporter [Xanthomonas fragariae]|uniref:Sialic acid transporter n=1 Tax=Xanthomonas fragariae TaxID=48664 RepID=A0ABY1RQG1_9XANT|nr:putative sialic acid transporter [Xanthomonas fragariae]
MVTASALVVALMTPALLQSAYGYAASVALQANSVAIVLHALGCVVSGALSDRLGSGQAAACCSSAAYFLGISAWLFYRLAGELQLLFPLYALQGASLGILGAVPRILVEAFPTVMRLSGVSFA